MKFVPKNDTPVHEAPELTVDEPSARRMVLSSLRQRGLIVVIGRGHVSSPEDLVNIFRAVDNAGYVAEATFRIDIDLVREAMPELIRLRDLRRTLRPGDPLILAVGSVINPHELETAIELGFEMIVGPDSAMGGYGEKVDALRICQEAGVLHIPGVFTPTELAYYLERNDGLTPEALKVFNAEVYGPSGMGGLLAPYERDRHHGRIIIPTGGLTANNAREFRTHIERRGFFPVLAMSSPLSLVSGLRAQGDPNAVERSLNVFREEYQRLAEMSDADRPTNPPIPT